MGNTASYGGPPDENETREVPDTEGPKQGLLVLESMQQRVDVDVVVASQPYVRIYNVPQNEFESEEEESEEEDDSSENEGRPDGDLHALAGVCVRNIILRLVFWQNGEVSGGKRTVLNSLQSIDCHTQIT